MNFRVLKKSAYDIYINESIDTDKDGNSLTLMDIVDDGSNIDDIIDLSIRSDLLYRFLNNTLDEREAKIMILRYGLYGTRSHTQNEVASKLEISRSYVSRIEKKALTKLKKMFEITPY